MNVWYTNDRKEMKILYIVKKIYIGKNIGICKKLTREEKFQTFM